MATAGLLQVRRRRNEVSVVAGNLSRAEASKTGAGEACVRRNHVHGIARTADQPRRGCCRNLLSAYDTAAIQGHSRRIAQSLKPGISLSTATLNAFLPVPPTPGRLTRADKHPLAQALTQKLPHCSPRNIPDREWPTLLQRRHTATRSRPSRQPRLKSPSRKNVLRTANRC